MLLNWKIAALSWACGVFAVPTVESIKAPTAIVKNGTYTGVYSPEYNQDFFLGIPYAQPPVGNNRFRVPQALNTSWTSSKPATSYSAACVGYGSDEIAYSKLSEDCLYLNVVRPAGLEGKKLPIAFWIHGGGLYEGSAIDQRYNLSFIVERSVKIGKPILGVSINYRLSMWGFITGDEVLKSGNANLGFRDQRKALDWVKENIEAFGGDPSQTTIWGESAGALSVGMHLTAYGGRDDRLFRGGIMESGNPVFYSSLRDWNKTKFNAVAAAMNCDTTADALQCLREVPFEPLNNYVNQSTLSGLTWQPLIDGDFIKGYTSEQLAQGEFVHVPVMSGANSDEGTAFATTVTTEKNLTDTLETYPFPAPIPSASVPAILHAYPPDLVYGAVPTAIPADSTPQRQAYEYAGDAVMIAHRRLTCQTWAASRLPVYCYRFNTIPNGIPASVGATHFQEVSFVFNNKAGVGYPPVSVDPFAGKPKSYGKLSDKMSEAWIRFVHDGAPSSGWWPQYGTGCGSNYVFDANATGLGYVEQDDWREEGIDLINSWNLKVYGR